jgi:hypothetical protein
VKILKGQLMTPQAFSYGTVGNNNMIYVPPYGLTESIDYMIKINPVTLDITRIPLSVSDATEKWQYGTLVGNKIVFLPYNENKILIVDCNNDSIEYVDFPFANTGKYVTAHVHGTKVVALPYGEQEYFDYACSYDVETKTLMLKKIECVINDQKKWHTSQYLDGKLYAVPRGERWTGDYFPYAIELDCDTLEYKLTDMSNLWADYDQEGYSNKKYTTLAKVGNKLYAPPYSENPNFDIMLKFNNGWTHERTGLQATSRKYYSHTVAANGKVYFPPAGHEEDWSEMLIIDSCTDTWRTIKLGIAKESKKYFTGCENSQGKIYYIPRGGCVCEPEESWKGSGDLAEILVVDTNTDTFYTVDISEYFVDNTTIEKYNCSVIVDDKIFALPYGESDSFQTLLVFDTSTETVIKAIDLNDI